MAVRRSTRRPGFSRPLGMIPERLELIRPECLDMIDPLMQDRERFRPEPVDPDPGVVLHVDLGDDPATTQHPQVPARRRTTHSKGVSDLTSTAGVLPQQFNDAATCRLGQGSEGAINVSNHTVK